MRKTVVGVLVTVAGPLAALVLAHVMTDAPGWVWQAMGVLCGVAGILIIALVDPVHGWLSRVGRMLAVFLVALACAVVGGGAYLLITAATNREAVTATAVLVEYEPTQPPDSVRPGQTIYLLNIRSDGPSELISTSGNYDIKRGPRVDPFVYYCTISNKGDATVLELEITYRATFFKGSPNQSPIVSTRAIHIGWPALAPNEKFSFYIDNGSEFGLAVQSIPEGTAKIFGRDKRQSLNIVPGNWGDFSLLFVPPHVPPKRIPN